MIKRKSQFRSIRVEWPIPPNDCRAIRNPNVPTKKIQGTQTGLEAVEGQQIIGGRQRPISPSLAEGIWQTPCVIALGFHRLD